MAFSVKKIGVVGATATGAVIGTIVAGPIGLAAGTAVGGAIDWWRHHKRKRVKGEKVPSHMRVEGITTAPAAPPPKPSAAVHQQVFGVPVPVVAPPSKAGQPIPPKPLVSILATTSAPPAQVQTAANAAPAQTPAEATALYSYFQKYPYDRLLGGQFWQSPAVSYRVTAFQRAFNAAPESATLGQLKVSGLYDSKTAAALTLYTHDPVASDPSAG